LVRAAITGFNGAMLTEEALLLLATLVAAGLLVLGVVELVWPSTPRRRARGERRAPSARATSPFASAPIAEDAPAMVPSPPVTMDEPTVAAAPSSEPPAVGTPDAGAVEEPPRALEPALPHAATTEPERRPKRRTSMPARAQRVLPIETCLGMFNDGRFKEVVSLGSAALQVRARMASVCDRPHEAAALHDLVGLAKQHLGDRDGARDAFLAAIHDAEPSLRDAYIGHLVALVGDAASGGPGPMDTEAEIVRVRELRGWVVALGDALSVAPGNDALAQALGAIRDALSPACERIVGCVGAEGEREEARTLVAETLADPAMPAAWRERLCEQLTAASSAEIGQLTAQAIRSVQDGKDGEALETLERAERLAAALPDGAVTDERREEFERRLWWGYTKVGLRRCEVRDFDGAVEPLFRALHLGGIDPDRAGETRAALVRALEGAVEARWAAIEQFGVTDRGALRSELEKLSAALHGAAARGLSEEDLAGVFAKVAHLEQSLRT
jgi:hypothetical protein